MRPWYARRVWESTFLVTCAFLGDDAEAALAHLDEAASARVAPLGRVLRAGAKLDRARALAAEIDAVKRALQAMELDPWR